MQTEFLHSMYNAVLPWLFAAIFILFILYAVIIVRQYRLSHQLSVTKTDLQSTNEALDGMTELAASRLMKYHKAAIKLERITKELDDANAELKRRANFDRISTIHKRIARYKQGASMYKTNPDFDIRSVQAIAREELALALHIAGVITYEFKEEQLPDKKYPKITVIAKIRAIDPVEIKEVASV